MTEIKLYNRRGETVQSSARAVSVSFVDDDDMGFKVAGHLRH